ncbi:MAG: GGDEF domain-containing protein [Acidimicrobiia bacterium]
MDRGATWDRLAVVSAMRVVLIAATLTLPTLTDAPRDGLVPLTVAYGLVTVAAELVRRFAHPFAIRAAVPIGVLDGAFVILGIVATGGPSSPLAAEVYLVVAASGVLVSPSSGLGVSLWCVLLLAGARAGEDLAWWSLPGQFGDRAIAVAAASYMVVGLGVGAAQVVSEGGLRRRGDRAAALVALGAAFEDTDNDESVAVALAGHARDTLGFRRAAAVVCGRDLWRGASADGKDELLFARDGPLGGSADAAFERAEANLVRVLDPGLLTDVLPNAKNIVLAPLVGERGAVGIVAGEWGGGPRQRVPVATVRALEAAATQAGRALDRQARLQEVARLATRDSVTGLANRRLFEETLDLELGRARRYGTPLSLVVLDVDHFKQVNDSAGHGAGDEVLGAVGRALVSMTKASDLAARYGGDEFVVLLPGCPRSEVAAVAERVRDAVANGVERVPVTISAGVATIPDDALDAEGLVATADAALYVAKHEGRDRTAAPPS